MTIKASYLQDARDIMRQIEKADAMLSKMKQCRNMAGAILTWGGIDVGITAEHVRPAVVQQRQFLVEELEALGIEVVG